MEGGGFSPDTFTANWLHVEGRGWGGVQSRYVHREGLHCGGGGGGGSVLIRGYL